MLAGPTRIEVFRPLSRSTAPERPPKRGRPRAEERGAGRTFCQRSILFLDSQVPRAALPIHQQKSFVFRAAEGALEIRCVPDGVMIYFLNHIAALQSGIGGSASGIDFRHLHASRSCR